MENYVCFDGVDCEVSYYETEEKALKTLAALVDESLDEGEWMDGVERCFVAKITHTIKQVKRELDEEEREIYGGDCVDMIITKNGAL